MAGTGAKGGKKNRKHGHNKTRSLSMARYRAEGRMAKNKEKAIKREEKRKGQDAARVARRAATREALAEQTQMNEVAA